MAECGEDARRLLRAVHEILDYDHRRRSRTAREWSCRALSPFLNLCDSHTSYLSLCRMLAANFGRQMCTCLYLKAKSGEQGWFCGTDCVACITKLLSMLLQYV